MCNYICYHFHSSQSSSSISVSLAWIDFSLSHLFPSCSSSVTGKSIMQAVNVETMMDTTGFISVIKATIKSIALILSAQFGSLCTRFFRYSSSHYNKFTNGKFEVFLNSTSLSQIIAIMWYFIFRMSCLPKNLYDWDLITYLIKPASNVMMIHLDPKFSFFLSYFLSCSLSFFYF